MLKVYMTRSIWTSSYLRMSRLPYNTSSDEILLFDLLLEEFYFYLINHHNQDQNLYNDTLRLVTLILETQFLFWWYV